MAAGGPAQPGRPLTGTEPARPVTAYGRSKLAAEAAVTAGTLPWVIVRPPTVYGPRDREVLKVFRMARLGVAPVFGDGSQQLSAVHGADLADALVAAGTAPATVGKIYYPCHPEIATSAEFVRAVGERDGPPAGAGPDPGAGRARAARGDRGLRPARRPDDDPHPRQGERVLSGGVDRRSRLRSPGTPDGAPTHDLASGLADTYRWYRSAGWL